MPTEYATIIATVEEASAKLNAAALEGFMLHSFQTLVFAGQLSLVCVVEKSPVTSDTVQLPEPVLKKALGMRCS